MCLRLKKVHLKKNDKLIFLLNSLNADYTVENGFVNVVINTNIKFVEPTTYTISDPPIITILENEKNYFCRTGKWDANNVGIILHNTLYIGKFSYRKSNRKVKDVMIIDDYYEAIIDLDTWSITRININKNKHPNYGLHIHLFNSMLRCPSCGKILSSSNSMKNTGTPRAKTYYHLVCENK